MNPYAPPEHRYPPPMAHGYGVVGGYAAWMDGPNLSVQKEAPLPSVCVKCGTDGTFRRNQQFVWTPPWVFIIFFISPIIGAVVAMIVQKKGRLLLPLCEPCNGRWKAGTLMIVGGVLYLFVALFAGIAIAANDLPEVGVPVLVSSIVVLIVSIVVANKRFLRAAKVDEQMISIRGVHPHAIQAILTGAAPR